MKVIAFFVPQYHRIPENDMWWGEGFTEWDNVRGAIKYDNRQKQPRVPLNGYYRLDDKDELCRQAQMARENGVDGFCIYHYWFSGHKLLEKPAEILLKNEHINIDYCFCWANEDWTDIWKSSGKMNVLIRQEYGDKDEWQEHFAYLKQFFADKRYIKRGNRPLVVIYRPDIIPCLDEMLLFWNELAKEEGFDGLSYAYQRVNERKFNTQNGKDHLFDIRVEYQPVCVFSWMNTPVKNLLLDFKYKLIDAIMESTECNLTNILTFRKKGVPDAVDYDTAWDCILKHKPQSKKCVPCAFVDWDNTPRRKGNGSYFFNVSPEKFERYFSMLLRKQKEEYEIQDYMFVFAWNEWGEGGYLEPDTYNGFGYLNAIKKARNYENTI